MRDRATSLCILAVLALGACGDPVTSVHDATTNDVSDTTDTSVALDTSTSDSATPDVDVIGTDVAPDVDVADVAPDTVTDSLGPGDWIDPTETDVGQPTEVIEDVEVIEEVAPPTLGCTLVAGPTHVYRDELVAAEVRVTVPGLTDRTLGVDADPDLLLELGRGAPLVFDDSYPAEPVPDWHADAVAPAEDAYRFELDFDALGESHYGARLSIDGGDTWTECGASVITVAADPCASSPCVLPAPTCEGDVATRYAGPAQCHRGPADLGSHSCDAGALIQVDCAADFELCRAAACVRPAITCSAQFPSAVTLFADQSFTAYARFAIEGTTSSTDGNDLGEGVRVEWSVDEVAWSAAAPNPGWSASAAGAAGLDEWQALIPAPDSPGVTSYRFRVSADAGDTWTTCSGTSTITVVADPCASTPCGATPPPSSCDGDVVVSYATPATCVRPAVATDVHTCEPPVGTRSDCSPEERCHDGACEAPDVWCRLQFPMEVTLYPDERATTYTRVFVEGLSPEVDQLDPPDYLRVEAGVAAASTTPSFVWTPAAPNPGWTGAAEPANLEWMADIAAPDAAGTYVYAFRVSADDGVTWTLCDGDLGEGRDGAEDGFSAEHAGIMTVVADPCPAACNTAPNGCDGQTLVRYDAAPVCTRPPSHVGAASCDYGAATRIDCGASSLVCDAGALACVIDPPCDPSPCVTPPAATCDGDTVVTYAAPATCDGGLCAWSETRTACTNGQLCDGGACRAPATWCRLQHPHTVQLYQNDDAFDSYGRFYVEGVTDRSNRNDPAPNVRFQFGWVYYTGAAESPPGAQWRWFDATPNAGYVALDEPHNDEWTFTYDDGGAAFGYYRYIYRLSADSGQTWTYCDYDFGDGRDGSENGYSEGEGGVAQFQFDPCASPTACTPTPRRCEGDTLVTFEGEVTCTRPADAWVNVQPICDYGPETRRDCALTGHHCDSESKECLRPLPWCRLQYPPETRLLPDETASAYARVYLPGITDVTGGNDPDVHLELQLGTGPVGSEPYLWTDWTAATPNPGWNGGAVGEPNNDEYQGTLHGGDIETVSFAFRARWSGDDGRSDWVYCDRDFGPGMDGAEDGYQPERAGTLTRLGDPCEVNPCTSPPPGSCNGDVLTPKKSPGVCTAVDYQAHCAYPEDDAPVNCAAFDGVCRDGVCDPRDVFCRLQFPDSASLQTGQSTMVYGRYYVAGVTDLTRGNDFDPYVIGALGQGPGGAHPTTWPESAWVAATPNTGYLAPESGNERNNDELQATLVAPDEGCDVAYAYRMSTDGGRSWTYCDRHTGDGQDGSADGYQVDRAGSLRVIPGPVALRVTDITIDYFESHPLVEDIGPAIASELDQAEQSGALNLVIELKPWGESGHLGLHEATLVDPQCRRDLDPCEWRVPLSGLDDETCRSTVDGTYTFGGGYLQGSKREALYLLNGHIPVYGLTFAFYSVQVLPDGSIGNVRGSMFASFDRADFPELTGPGDIDGDGDGALDEFRVRFAIEGVGGRIIGVE